MQSRYYSRKEASEFLESRGFPISPRTLAKYVCTGGGPEYRKFGNRCLYAENSLLAWAEGRMSKPVSNSSELEA